MQIIEDIEACLGADENVFGSCVAQSLTVSLFLAVRIPGRRQQQGDALASRFCIHGCEKLHHSSGEK